MDNDDFRFFTDGLNLNTVIMASSIELNFFVMQTAASLSVASRSYSIDDSETGITNAIEEEVASYVNMASHGYKNALQSQAEFLYNYAEQIISTGKPPFMRDKQTAILLTNALQEYQTYKTKVCKKDEEKYGEGFGSKTGYNTKDWTDLSEKFLKLFKQ